MEKKIIGRVEKEPTTVDGRITFAVRRESDNKIIFCISGSDFAGAKPMEHEKVVLLGEQKTDLILGVTPYFVVSAIEKDK